VKCRECIRDLKDGHAWECSVGKVARKYCKECHEKLAKIGSDYCGFVCYRKARRLNGL
jgi:hypothetical protein